MYISVYSNSVIQLFAVGFHGCNFYQTSYSTQIRADNARIGKERKNIAINKNAAL